MQQMQQPLDPSMQQQQMQQMQQPLDPSMQQQQMQQPMAPPMDQQQQMMAPPMDQQQMAPVAVAADPNVSGGDMSAMMGRNVLAGDMMNGV